METTDIVVIGGGIAGLSAGSELAAEARVTVLEMEAQPGYHATGRSAAFYAAAYGDRLIQDLTACCEPFLRDPPDGFTDLPLLRPRDCMYFGRPDQAASLEAKQASDSRLEFLDAATVRERVPVFTGDYLHGAVRDPVGGDIDVDALLQGFIRLFRRRGGQLVTECRVDDVSQRDGCWQVRAAGRDFRAPVVINAAGAWAGSIGTMAGLGTLGLQPLRRTALTVDPPAGVDISGWPEMMDVDEEFYFKPDAGLILVSPADETPSAPCDAQPEELDVATGVYRFEQATGLDIRQVRSSWAGLRTFTPDRLFVAGFDPRCEGFFWLAGQGGYGIYSAPALSRLTRHLVLGSEPEPGFASVADFASALAPDRLL